MVVRMCFFVLPAADRQEEQFQARLQEVQGAHNAALETLQKEGGGTEAIQAAHEQNRKAMEERCALAGRLGGGGGGIRGRPTVRGKRTYGARPGQRVKEQGTWASRTQKHSEAGYGRPVDRGVWTAKTGK